jgi:hypothetical protein
LTERLAARDRKKDADYPLSSTPVDSGPELKDSIIIPDATAPHFSAPSKGGPFKRKKRQTGESS